MADGIILAKTEPANAGQTDVALAKGGHSK